MPGCFFIPAVNIWHKDKATVIMKLLDKFIRYWRVEVALKNRPKLMENVFDIGCDDGYLLQKLSHITKRQDGVDPRLNANSISPESEIKKGFFPSVIEDYQMQGTYDAIFALAVFEHFSEKDIQQSAFVISRMLSPEGRLIITAPHRFADKILNVLIFFHLMDGTALEDHHGFDPEALIGYFSDSLRLVKRKRFQFGLNNIFIFGRF
jgi:2-polyprenyl-3-methyl-5-hydroxy-6-metoxy-1,4-benzoquinol methylase